MNIIDNFFKSCKQSISYSSVEYIVVGLGNPGQKYENTRHNAGFMAIDYIAKKNGITLDSAKFKGFCAISMFAQKKVLLLKPQTFMNDSGVSVLSAMSFYKLKPERLIVMCDDIYLPIGKIRVRSKGSHGGQNGMKSVINLCGTDKFARIKIGIGQKPNPSWDLADWVLSRFSDLDLKNINEVMSCVEGALELIVNGNVDAAMRTYN